MLKSPLDKKDSTIRTDSIISFETSYFALNGSMLELEGYASVKGLQSYSEDRIRKTLLLVPELNFEEYRTKLVRESGEPDQLITDEDIIDMFTIRVPMENCVLPAVKNADASKINDEESLGGFKVVVDLSIIQEGKPLAKGNYHVYIKLEQLANEDDDVRYEKIISLADIRGKIKNNMMTTQLHYFSATRNLKYNLIASFNNRTKTLMFENTLLQSFNPKEMAESEDEPQEHRKIQAIKRRFFKLFFIIFSLLPIKKRKVTIASDSRDDLSGNLYFVYEEIYKRDLNVEIKLILNNRINSKKTFIELLTTAYHFATSKIILLDDFYPLIYPLNIRGNQDLIQVWHAAGAFKTFGFSRTGRAGGPSPKSRNHRNYTKATVSSEGVREHYAEGFGITSDKVYATGVPRADIFFDEEYKSYVKSTLYDKYPFLKDKKVILFAPTFRGNGQSSAFFPFHVVNQKHIYENLKDDYVFLFKIHPFVNNKLNISYEYADFFYDFSDFREINDLLLITDILITDYSSVCFEFALLNKPMLFFGFDVEEYTRTRDFYYNFFDFIPGPLVKTSEEIVEKIKQQDFEMHKIEPFVKYFFNGTLGRASRNVVDQVIIPSLESNYTNDKEVTKRIVPPQSRFELFDRSIEEEEEEIVK